MPIAGVRRIHGDAVDLVGARERDRGKALVVLQAPVLVVAVVGPAQVEPARRHLEIGGDDEGLHFVGEVDLGRGLHGLGDHLHADPAAGVARHRDAQQPHLDHFVDAGGIEIRHQRRDEGMVGLMRHGGGFGAVIVAGQTQHAAVFRRARGIAVTEYVAAAVDAGTLAVPDADHAIVPGAAREIELLRAPDRGGREVFVHAGLELDVVLIEMFSRGEQLLVVAAERRTPVSRDKTGGVQPRRAIPADLRHRQADQRLNAGQEDMAGALGVFLIEADRTLVDSHFHPLEAQAALHRGGSFYLAIQPVRARLESVYVAFCDRRITNLGNGAPHSQIAISCAEWPQALSLYVPARALREMT